MTLTKDLLDAIATVADRSLTPLFVPWPMRGNLNARREFSTFDLWREFVIGFKLRDGLPQIVTAKFERAQKLYLVSWIDFDLITAGELVALTTLELALQNRYGRKVKGLHKTSTSKSPNPRQVERAGRQAVPFAELLKYMPEHDALTDDKLPMIRRCGGSIVGLLTGDRKPSLAQIRNDLAHGQPFNSGPQAGLLELVRDLIEYAYRDTIAVG